MKVLFNLMDQTILLKYFFIFGIVLIVLLNIPYFFSNGNIFIGYSWDFLDSNVIWNKLITENNNLLRPNNYPITEFMNSKRVSLGSEFNFLTLLILFFKPFLGYVINQFLIQIIAFWGMISLLDKYVFNEKYTLFNFVISLTFSLLPFWLSGGMSVAGMPAMLFVFINILNNTAKKHYWFLPILYSFYSSFFVFGLFFMLFLFSIFLLESYKTRIIKFQPIVFFGLMILCYSIVEWRILWEIFIQKTFIPHRVEFDNPTSLKESFENSKSSFFNGQDHVKSFHSKYLIFLSAAAIFISFISRKSKIIFYIFSSILTIAFLHGILSYKPIYYFLKTVPVINGFQMDRFYTLYPFLWYFIYAILVYQILEFFKNRFIKGLFLLIGALQLFFILQNNIQIIGICDLVKDKKEIYTFNDYFAKNTFDYIKKDINKPLNSYKVMCLGIQPSVIVYNNIQTIDGYNSFYDVEYKHKFRKIIEKELELNSIHKKYFDKWGSRCYIFDNQNIDFDNFNFKLEINELQLNYEIAKKMRVKYLISTYSIKNHQSLEIFKIYKDKLRIYYIYKLI
jgi:Protein of unknown function (DUF6044)